MLSAKDVVKAHKVLSGVVANTPLDYDHYLSEKYGAKIYLKKENAQRVRSFKIRGAYYAISQLTKEERERGVVCASAGNHAQGVAYAAEESGIEAVIVMPKSTPLIKVESTKKYGAEVVLYGDVYDDAFKKAKELEEKEGYIFVHPFNDEEVLYGQGTIALEILEKLYNLRYKSGKIHLFHSVNKIVGRFGNVVSLDKIYVSKEYLSYLSEKLFQDKNRLISFFGGNNKFVRLSLVQEFIQDFGRDIAQDIKLDFLELKEYNSSVFKTIKERILALKENENEDITNEDIVLIQSYLSNWKKLQDKIKYFIPEEFYGKKNNYFYTSLLSYVKFLEKLNPDYEIGIKYLQAIN